MHFIQGIDHDPVKAQFVRSIQSIAEKSATRVNAEGIETHAELLMVRDIGVACGQGYHIARPRDAEQGDSGRGGKGAGVPSSATVTPGVWLL